MPAGAIGAIGVAGAMPAMPPMPALEAAGSAPALGAPGVDGAGGGFDNIFANALDGVEAAQANADALAQAAATGTLEDVHDYTIAATEAALRTDLVLAVRNRAVEAFNEIMRMPL